MSAGNSSRRDLALSPASSFIRPAAAFALVLTGDPRPGKNVFDVEVSMIRQHLPLGSRYEHLAMIELGEIAATIDRCQPTVLHIVAHRSETGVMLSKRQDPFAVDVVDLAEAI